MRGNGGNVPFVCRWYRKIAKMQNEGMVKCENGVTAKQRNGVITNGVTAVTSCIFVCV